MHCAQGMNLEPECHMVDLGCFVRQFISQLGHIQPSLVTPQGPYARPSSSSSRLRVAVPDSVSEEEEACHQSTG